MRRRSKREQEASHAVRLYVSCLNGRRPLPGFCMRRPWKQGVDSVSAWSGGFYRRKIVVSRKLWTMFHVHTLSVLTNLCAS